MNTPPHKVFGLLAVAVLVGSCVAGDSPTNTGEVRLEIPIQPALIPSPADGSAAPVNRIRATVRRVADGVEVGGVSLDVDPGAAEWTIVVDATVPISGPVSVIVDVLLLNATGADERIQFSGRVGPLSLSRGQTVEQTDIPIVRGPVGNLFVTGVTIETVPDTLREGDTATLQATVTTSDESEPTSVYWTVLDSATLSTVDSVLRGGVPGVGRVVASAGSHTDTASIFVRAAPASVDVSPDTAYVAGVGGQATFQAAVLDARGDTLEAESVTWSSASPLVIASLGGGLFDALQPGSGTVRATVASSPSVMGTAVMVVSGTPPAAADVAVLKSVDERQPLEDSTVVFTVRAVNLGPDTVTQVVVFDTLPSAPFVTPAHVVSAGTLTGDSLWSIPSLAPGDTATWTTTTVVATGAAGGSATNTAYLRSLAQNDSTPANDTSAITVSFPISAVPVVEVLAPAEGAVFDPGDLVTFMASADDAEEGDLSASIVWTSSVEGTLATGASFESDQLTTGVHTIVASATDSDGGTGTDSVTITIALITTPTTLNVPFAGTASLPITLSEPARAGGITLSVSSADESITVPSSGSVFIPGGARSANATLSGAQPGVTDVTVAHPQFGSSVTSVSVTAALNVLQTTLSVPETFPQPIDVRLESQGQATAAPVGGLQVALTSVDPACVSAPTSVTIEGGLVQARATLAAGGGATLPCTTYVRAEAPLMAPDSVRVTVTPPPTLSLSSTQVGSGLQYGSWAVSMGTSQHGGVTVRVESADPTTMLVSPDANTAGTAFVDLFVPNGSSVAFYHVHGVQGRTGAVALGASAAGFAEGSATITVVQPALQLAGLGANTTALAGEDAFFVRVGTPNPQLTALSAAQAVRIGGDTLTVTLTSSAPSVGDLVTLPDSTTPVTVRIPPGSFDSPTSVAAGGVAFSPASAGTSTVSATIPGFLATTAASMNVAVTTPGITVFSQTVGTGLQTAGPYAGLGAAQHGGVTVTIESADPSVFLVSPDASTAGSPSIQVAVPNGQTGANYYLHGVATDTVPVRVSAPGFATDSADVRVVPASYEIIGLGTSTTSFSPDDPFLVRVGVPNGQQTALGVVQAVSIGGSTLTANLTSSNVQVGELITLPDSASPVTVQILPGQSSSPGSVGLGGVAFDPIGQGSTRVTAAIDALVPMPNAVVDVSVSAPGINTSQYTVGAGLQYGLLTSSLGATNHPGVTVRIESTNPQILRVSANDSTPGTAFVDVPVAAGQNAARFYLHGVEGTAGSVPLVVSAPGFVPDTTDMIVTQPAHEIVGLGTSPTTFSPDDPFQVRVGVPYPGNPSLWIVQPVRAGADTLSVTVRSTNTGVGVLETEAQTGATVTVRIPPRSFTSPASVALGGVAFDPLGIGSTTVSSSLAGYIATTAASQTVTVSAPGISVASQTTVGAGLQYGLLTATLGATNHGGVTVTLTSSNPSVFVLAPDAVTPGQGSLQLFVPDGQNAVRYYVQGVEGAQATATLTVSANGFTNGVGSVEVVTPALDIIGLGTVHSATGGDDSFVVRLGVPYPNDTDIWIQQALRAGSSPLTATVTSSAPQFGRLVTTGTTGGSVTVQIAAGSTTSPNTVAGGGVAFDPLAAGSTTVRATIPGFTTTTQGAVNVTINP